MSKAREIPYPRILAEGTAIIVSILLAFWIQAWWESRGDANQEQALLAALSDDFAQAEELLSQAKSWHTMTAKAGEQLITISESESISDSERDSIEMAVSAHFARAFFDPPMGTVESVLGSGRIDLMTNHKLVAELT